MPILKMKPVKNTENLLLLVLPIHKIRGTQADTHVGIVYVTVVISVLLSVIALGRVLQRVVVVPKQTWE